MAHAGKRIVKARESVERTKLYKLDDAVKLVKERATAKFDETVELALNLGVDPKHADQMVRGVVNLPNGTGRVLRVAVFARGAKADEARAAGADIAVVYGASSQWSDELFVADFDAGLYHGGFFADLATRLKELAKACRAQCYFVLAPRGAYPIYRAARAHGRRNPALVRSGRNPAFRRRVKFCPPTIDKMAIHPLGAALSFKADDPVEAALQGAFLAAISLKFDQQLSSKPKPRH